jgi:putative ABC transport system permease protein
MYAGWMETIIRDLRYAIRMIWRSPGTSLVALISLMLGIGATTAIFSVVYAVIVNPYPYSKPDEIWAPSVRALTGRGGHGDTLDDLREIRKLPVFADVMATNADTVLLTGDYAPETLTGVRMTANGFQFLAVPSVVGRGLQPSDVGPDGVAAPVVVLSFQLWQRLFQGDPGAIGKTLRIDGVPRTIVGVMPSRFGWFTSDGVWMPLGTTPQDAPPWMMIITRLTPGTSPQAAQTQLHAMYLRTAKERPTEFPKDGFSTTLRNYMDMTVASGPMQTTLQLLFGAVGFLLLIACANVANLQLARATARTREMAVRLSMGATRGRVLRQLLTESVLLAVVGGLLGVLFAFAATEVIVALMPAFFVPNEARVTIDGLVLIFALVIAVITGILFGLAPALQASKPDLIESLKDRSSGAGPRSGKLRSSLVVAEVALSVVLLVGAGLTMRSFIALQQVDLGFRAEHLLQVDVPLPPQRYPTLAQRNQFAQQLLESVKTIPGIEAASLGNGSAFGGPRSPFTIPGHPNADPRPILLSLAGADYLRVLGIPLKSGRPLTDHEVDRGDRVALINEAARALWPAGEDPIGRRIHLGVLERAPGPGIQIAPGSADLEIVGVVGNTRNNGLTSEALPALIIPYPLVAPLERTLMVRTQGDPNLSLNAIRDRVRALDKDQPLGEPFTLDKMLGFQTKQPRFMMVLFGFFAALGLALATAGIYSLLSYQVALRSHEIGIRIALGAQRSSVIGLMLANGGRLVAIGLVIGLIASVAVSGLLRSLLAGIAPTDPLSFALVTVVLVLVTLTACYVPARRAGAVDPMKALRHE